jgi:hypothetical protein
MSNILLLSDSGSRMNMIREISVMNQYCVVSIESFKCKIGHRITYFPKQISVIVVKRNDPVFESYHWSSRLAKDIKVADRPENQNLDEMTFYKDAEDLGEIQAQFLNLCRYDAVFYRSDPAVICFLSSRGFNGDFVSTRNLLSLRVGAIDLYYLMCPQYPVLDDITNLEECSFYASWLSLAIYWTSLNRSPSKPVLVDASPREIKKFYDNVDNLFEEVKSESKLSIESIRKFLEVIRNPFHRAHIYNKKNASKVYIPETLDHLFETGSGDVTDQMIDDITYHKINLISVESLWATDWRNSADNTRIELEVKCRSEQLWLDFLVRVLTTPDSSFDKLVLDRADRSINDEGFIFPKHKRDLLSMKTNRPVIVSSLIPDKSCACHNDENCSVCFSLWSIIRIWVTDEKMIERLFEVYDKSPDLFLCCFLSCLSIYRGKDIIECAHDYFSDKGSLKRRLNVVTNFVKTFYLSMIEAYKEIEESANYRVKVKLLSKVFSIIQGSTMELTWKDALILSLWRNKMRLMIESETYSDHFFFVYEAFDINFIKGLIYCEDF